MCREARFYLLMGMAGKLSPAGLPFEIDSGMLMPHFGRKEAAPMVQGATDLFSSLSTKPGLLT
jgi:hypothetical protein